MPWIVERFSDVKGSKTDILLCDRGGIIASPLTRILNGARQCGTVDFQGTETVVSEEMLGVTSHECVFQERFAFQ